MKHSWIQLHFKWLFPLIGHVHEEQTQYRGLLSQYLDECDKRINGILRFLIESSLKIVSVLESYNVSLYNHWINTLKPPPKFLKWLWNTVMMILIIVAWQAELEIIPCSKWSEWLTFLGITGMLGFFLDAVTQPINSTITSWHVKSDAHLVPHRRWQR